MERAFKDGDIVSAGYKYKFKMKVTGATECLKGWKYKCCFMKKDGTPDKRMEARWYFENELNKG